MKTLLPLAFVSLLLVFAVRPAFALMSIEEVSPERAKALGMEIKSNAAGPDTVRVVLSFELKGELKNYVRVDLEIHQEGRLLTSVSLREDRSDPNRIVVAVAANRASLDKMKLRVVTQDGLRTMTGRDLRLKDFVDLEKLR